MKVACKRACLGIFLISGIGISSAAPTGAVETIWERLTGPSTPVLLNPDEAFTISTEASASDEILVSWRIADGYYLYRDKFEFSLPDSGVAAITSVSLPPGKLKNDPDFGQVEVNYHAVRARLKLHRLAKAETSTGLVVKYQGCKENVLCYPPITKTMPMLLAAHPTVVESTAVTVPAKSGLGQPPGLIIEHLNRGEYLQNVAIFFGFGLLLAFTPCVFPMLPILSGIIASQRHVTTILALAMSLVYVLAMALTYAALGVIAGLFGLNLQATFQNAWVITAFSGIFVVLSLSMFGFYELQLPASWQSKLSVAGNQHKGTLYGAGIMGALSAIIVGPCIAPPLAGALLYISQTGDAVLGGLALLAMGLGMGLPLLVVGTSAGKLLPVAGAWMNVVKQIFGVIMLGVAVWFMGRILPGPITLVLWALLLIVSAMYMGILDRIEKASPLIGLWRGLGFAMLVYGTVLLIGAAAGGNDVLRPLTHLSVGNHVKEKLPFRPVKGTEELQVALAEATSAGKPVLLDFYADWCVTCKEMERDTFADPGVKNALRAFVLLKADVTNNDTLDKALLKEFSIFGPPAILFFAADGGEKHPLRVVGFMGPDDFVKHLKGLTSG